MPSSSAIKGYSLFQQWLRVYSNQSTCHGCYAPYAPGAIEYRLSNMEKYQSCWSMGNTMAKYTRYIINTVEKAIWLILHECASVFSYSTTVQYPAILPSQPDSLYTTLILEVSRKQTATVTAHTRFKGCCCVDI